MADSLLLCPGNVQQCSVVYVIFFVCFRFHVIAGTGQITHILCAYFLAGSFASIAVIVYIYTFSAEPKMTPSLSVTVAECAL